MQTFIDLQREEMRQMIKAQRRLHERFLYLDAKPNKTPEEQAELDRAFDRSDVEDYDDYDY